MSAVAPAAVSAALVNLLRNGFGETAMRIGVGTGSPAALEGASGSADRLNLLLYKVTQTPTFARNLPLQRPSQPQLAPLTLDLHYLLSAHSPTILNAELLLGYAAAVLHAHPLLTGRDLEAAFSGVEPVDTAILPPPAALQTDLETQNMRLLLEDVTSPDLFALWRAIDAPMKPSLTIVISPVLI